MQEIKQTNTNGFYIQGQRLSDSEIFTIRHLFSEGKSIQQICDHTGHSYKTVQKYATAKKLDDVILPSGRLKEPIEDEDQTIQDFVDQLVYDNPAFQLHEIQYMVQFVFHKTLSIMTLHRLKKKLNMRRIRCSITSWRQKTPHIQMLRKQYSKVLNSLDPQLLVFVDETHKDASDIVRRYVSTKQKGTPFNYLPKQTGVYSAIVACTYFRPLIWHVKQCDEETGGVNTDDITLFFKQLFLAIPKNCIIVLDNARVHRNDQVIDLLNQSGFLYMFTAPYSPDLSPIEMVFSLMKSKVSRLALGNEDVPLDTLIHVVLDRYITSNHMESFYNHCKKKWEQESAQ